VEKSSSAKHWGYPTTSFVREPTSASPLQQMKPDVSHALKMSPANNAVKLKLLPITLKIEAHPKFRKR